MISNSQPSHMDRRTATTIFPLVDSSMSIEDVAYSAYRRYITKQTKFKNVVVESKLRRYLYFGPHLNQTKYF